MIITHTSPDWDAIGGCWLLQRFGDMADAEIQFVNTSNPDASLIEAADAVVDTGKMYYPGCKRFDHHHLPGDSSNDTCATMQVFEWIINWKLEEVKHLDSLIALIFDGDTGRPGAKFSRELGLHALLSGWKKLKYSDNAIMALGFEVLDAINAKLLAQAQAKEELENKVIFRSNDGYIWAIKHGSTSLTQAAYEAGARIVVFEGEPVQTENGDTYPIGIMRNSEWNYPHVGQLAEKVRDTTKGCAIDTPEYLIWNELGKWFLHPAGFFAGRGTPKAPVFEPVECDLRELVAFIDTAWER